MVMQDLRVRYQRSVLGFIWTLLNPILMLATLTIVFANLFDRSVALAGLFDLPVRGHGAVVSAGGLPERLRILHHPE